MADDRSLSWEILRKAAHVSGILIVVGYTLVYDYFSPRIALLSITALLLILIEIERIRLDHKPRIALLLEGIFRKHEQDSLSGAVFLVISCIICFAAFDYWVAFLAMFMTVFGDMAAAIFGKVFGRVPIYGTKTLAGTLACVLMNILVGLMILPNYIELVIPMAFTAAFFEFITIRLDDNLTVPLFAGFIGQMVVISIGLNLPPVDFTFLGLF